MQFLKLFFLSTLFVSSLLANIGTVTAIRGDVKITRGIALYQAHKNLEIEEKDTFFTNKNGSMQITFTDKTVITLGKNTVFKVAEYLYSENHRKKNKVKFKFRKGFFKSITGRIGKLAPKKFKISTKNATIGVRGTEITGTSDSKVEKIICTHGEIEVRSESTKKSFVAKANEHVKIKLDPKVKYVIAEPIDILIQQQVKAGLKKPTDRDVIKSVKKEMVIVFKPEVKKEMIRKGIDIKKVPVKREDIIIAPKKIKKEETKAIDKNFLVDKKEFRTHPVIREEINSMTQEEIEAIKEEQRRQEEFRRLKEEDERAQRERDEQEARRIKEEQERRFFQSEKKRVGKQQQALEEKWNAYKPKLPKAVPKEKVTTKKDALKSKIKQMDQILDSNQDRL